MEKSYIDRFNSFQSSLEGLKEAKKRDRTDTFVISGTIQKFSLTFDLSWKVMRDILVDDFAVTDFALGSPKEILKKAYSNGLIVDDRWMNMLKTRNDSIHDYDESLAEDAINVIIDEYIDLFEKFKNKVKELIHD